MRELQWVLRASPRALAGIKGMANVKARRDEKLLFRLAFEVPSPKCNSFFFGKGGGERGGKVGEGGIDRRNSKIVDNFYVIAKT